MKPNYEIVIFDLDGTLTDSKEGITKSSRYALSYMGIEVEDLKFLEKFIGPPIYSSFMDYYHMTIDEADIAVGKFRERMESIGVFECELYPGIKELLEELRRAGIMICIASAKAGNLIDQVMDIYHIREYFDHIEGSENDGTNAEKKDLLEKVLKKVNPDGKRRTVMVGDRIYDARGAEAVGLDFIGVLYGYGSKEEMQEAGGSVFVNSVEELREMLLAENTVPV